MTTKYFKLVWGYSPEDYVEIEHDELEKAYYCFLARKDGVFSGGGVQGNKIIVIQPDYHRVMGWNRGHKLDNYDYAELREKGIENSCRDIMLDTKLKVEYLVRNNKTELIGKNIDLKQIQNGENKS